jgi:hypothetical protein
MWVEVRDSKETWNRLLRTYLSPKPPRRNRRDGQIEPVAPDKPKPLIGGAAAPLEFDD